RPEARYFLQMILSTVAQGQFIRGLLEKLEFHAGLYERKKKFVVWFNEADTVCDFLGMLGAENAVERFEIARNVKEVRMQVNRVVNMETAALNKAIDAAQEQLADIKLLLDYKISVKPRLQEAMTLRLENPTCTVRELAEKIGMTAPGLLYRYHIINHLANNVRRKILRGEKIIGGL
ncbi:MAG: DNA-binding protein WhiA, partial [Selenomonadaceae bacterium]|nr:DNA-binding protein WhiA [Selenomonadaceae bacterium]